MINRINETIEMKDLPTWLQELWEQNPSLARRAEKHYLELTEQCNIANVVNRRELLLAWEKHSYGSEWGMHEDQIVPSIDEYLSQ